MVQITNIVQAQRDFFSTRVTYDIAYRIDKLKLLKKTILEFESEIFDALKKDLNKAPFESYVAEINIVLDEINYMLKNIKKLSKPTIKPTPLLHFPSVSKTYRDPYGVVLAMAPWNYPFQLSLVPVVGAIATGNCVVLKPANYASNTTKIISKIISTAFEPHYVTTVEGDRNVNKELLDQHFDHIFFTGSPEIAKTVMEKAAKYLTPVTLELGGKSPCIVEKTANIDLAAKRIVWGKMLNSSQTCIAPDYILAHSSIKQELIEGIKKYVGVFYGENPETNYDYPKMINEKHFDRISGLLHRTKPIWGGNVNKETHQISLAILDNVQWEDEIMQDEIFGPILPIITFETLEEIILKINERPKPLACYLFTQSKDVEKKVIKYISYGGGCVNDTIVHIANINLGFGGVGNSGMGTYHGKKSFETFSHEKGVLKKANWLDIPIRYPPYKNKLSWVKKILKFI